MLLMQNFVYRLWNIDYCISLTKHDDMSVYLFFIVFLSTIYRHEIDFLYFLLFHMSTRVHLARMKATQSTSIIWPVGGILQCEKITTTMTSHPSYFSSDNPHTRTCRTVSYQSVSDEDVDLITSFVLGRTFFLPIMMHSHRSLPLLSSPLFLLHLLLLYRLFFKHERNE